MIYFHLLLPINVIFLYILKKSGKSTAASNSIYNFTNAADYRTKLNGFKNSAFACSK